MSRSIPDLPSSGSQTPEAAASMFRVSQHCTCLTTLHKHQDVELAKKKKDKEEKKVSSLKALDTQAVSAVRLGMTDRHNLISNGSRVSISRTLKRPRASVLTCPFHIQHAML